MAHKIPIDWNLVDNMLENMYDGQSIASKLGISYDTFYNRGAEDKIWGEGTKYLHFSDYKAQKKSIALQNLEALQFETAMTTKNPTLMIWLSKNYLGFADKLETKTEEKVTINFVD